MKFNWSIVIVILIAYSLIILGVYTLLLNSQNIVLFPFLIVPTLVVLIYENTGERTEAEQRTPSDLLLTVFAFTCGGCFGILFFGIGLYGILLAIIAALLVVFYIPMLLQVENQNEI
ncbi:MAG: hypothetical protein P1Q69_10905 [Candidatus Thorarchaeota archaeon]|nr:hypothetical protein [Candidatus Thorarchaeota archaeon]